MTNPFDTMNTSLNATEKLKGQSRSIYKETKLIGLTGSARCGKDTIANMLANELNFQIYGFSYPLKEMMNIGLDLTTGDKVTQKAEELYEKSWRYIAQTLGTEWGRNTIHPDIWVKIAEERLKNTHTIIKDVRFDNEAEYIRKHGVVIHIIRPDQEIIPEINHISEDGIKNLYLDYNIINNIPIQELEIELHEIAKDIIVKVDHVVAWNHDEIPSPIKEENTMNTKMPNNDTRPPPR